MKRLAEELTETANKAESMFAEIIHTPTVFGEDKVQLSCSNCDILVQSPNLNLLGCIYVLFLGS